jgi:hypothetical protein
MEFGNISQTSNLYSGNDLDTDGKLVINGQRLYNIGNNEQYGNRQIEIDVSGSGFRIYTFTFG